MVNWSKGLCIDAVRSNKFAIVVIDEGVYTEGIILCQIILFDAFRNSELVEDLLRIYLNGSKVGRLNFDVVVGAGREEPEHGDEGK